jgi:hypothetical protein
MYYIKPCPSCGKKLRFPLDKGKLQIKCECGNSFLADPDDTQLFKTGYFDLSDKARPAWLGKIKNLNLKNLISKIITNLLEYKYSLQNFMLLTWKDQSVIIVKTLIALLVVFSFIFLIFMLIS